jgi:hypothetical protein
MAPPSQELEPPANPERFKALSLIGLRRDGFIYRMTADDLLGPDQFIVRFKDLAAGAYDEPHRNRSRDKWVKERIAGGD